MSHADREYARTVLLEAFTAGWQAGLAKNITNPRVLAVVEQCFDMWLSEAMDEADVLGLTFRGREDLPSLPRGGPPARVTRPSEPRRPDVGSSGRPPTNGGGRAVPLVPGQRFRKHRDVPVGRD
jgi:hypothetical protein